MLQILAKVDGGSALLTNFHSSNEYRSILHASIDKFSGAGQIDFGLVLRGKFPIALEYMGAGERMFILSGTSGVYIKYGEKTNQKLGEQIKIKIPSISISFDSNVYGYYEREASFVGKVNPHVTRIQMENVVTAMAMVYHPVIRQYIEGGDGIVGVAPGIYERLGGDPLKIALYMLQCDQLMPTIDWATGEVLKTKSGDLVLQPFYRICGFSSQHTAQVVQERFGLVISEDYQLTAYTPGKLREWWENRDKLIECLQAGTCAVLGSSGSDFEPAFDLFTAPM
ncbi:MAG: hypothetical protein ACTSRK_20570 [Promethearchaeota archaeon]